MTATEKRVVREKASAEVWRERVERWKSSGLQAKEFAASENLSPRSLVWWHWQLQRRSEVPARTKRSRRSKKRAASMSFVPVVVRAAEATAMEIVLPGEIRVRIDVGFDEATLLRLVRTLGSR
jgi:hypothetical protein